MAHAVRRSVAASAHESLSQYLLLENRLSEGLTIDRRSQGTASGMLDSRGR